MLRRSLTFRVFVSSTFSDMKAEREILQEKVFPALREFCQQRGARFQAVDLRWGVAQEAGLDQQTMNICLQELERCRTVSPKPNFIVLLGDRYGWRPLPAQISAQEFERLRDQMDAVDVGRAELWYTRDDNAVPPEYCLLPRTGEFVDKIRWNEVEDRLRESFRVAIGSLGWAEDDERRAKYEYSATHQEIQAGALNVDDADQHVFCYLRETKGLPTGDDACEYVDLAVNGVDQDSVDRLYHLKSRMREILPSKHVHDYSAEWRNSRPKFSGEAFAARVESDLKQVIDAEVKNFLSETALQREQLAHREFAAIRSRHFAGRVAVKSQISDYIASGARRPLTVVGAGGTGKTALLANVWKETCEGQGTEAVVTRFIGATAGSTQLRSLLVSLCEELGALAGIEESPSSDVNELPDEFAKRLEQAATNQRVVLFLDALDQLGASDNALELNWIPSMLPENVRIVTSVLRSEEVVGGAAYQSVGRRFHDTVLELQPLTTNDGNAILDAWLKDAGRTLQDNQRADVIGHFANNGLPLYLKLAFEEARRWKSYDGLPSGADDIPGLNDTVEGVLVDLFARLASERYHGRRMVLHSLGALVATRHGLTEDELLDLLSADEEVMSEFRRRSPNSPDIDQIPLIVWARLLADLEPYMAQRQADGTSVMTFYHRQVGIAVANYCFANNSHQSDYHRRLAKYFDCQGLWLESLDEQRARLRRISPSPRLVNVRTVSELPYQRLQVAKLIGSDDPQAEAWDEAADLFTDISFLEAKSEAGLVFELVENFSSFLHAIPVAHSRKRILDLLDEAIFRDVHFIDRYTTTLFQCLWNSCWWYDCAESVNHYDSKADKRSSEGISERQLGLKLCELLEGWLKEKETVSPTDGPAATSESTDVPSARIWIRSFRPPTVPLGSSQLAQLSGLERGVGDVAFSPDGLYVLAGAGKKLRIWASRSGQVVADFTDDQHWVENVAFCSDGRHVVGKLKGDVHSDDCVFVWNIESGDHTVLQSARKTSIGSPNGQHLIRMDGNHRAETLAVWERGVVEPFCELVGHTAGITHGAFSLDGRRIVSGSYDCTARLWDAETGEEINQFNGHTQHVLCVAFSPDGRLIASGSEDRTVRIWDAESAEELARHDGLPRGIESVAFGPGAGHLTAQFEDGVLRVWEAHGGDQIAISNGFVVNSDGRRIAFLNDTIHTRIWDFESGENFELFRENASRNSPMALSPNGHLTATAHSDNRVRVRDLVSGEQLLELVGHSSSVRSVAFSPDGRRIVSGSCDCSVRLWDAETGEEVSRFYGHTQQVNRVAFSPDGRLIVSGSEDRTVRIWDAKSEVVFRQLLNHADKVNMLAYSGDGRRIAIASSDNTASVWDAESGERLVQLIGHDDWVNCVVLSDDGRRVVTGSSDTTVRVWDSENGSQLFQLSGHRQPVKRVALSADGRLIASGSKDNTVRIWDAESGKLISQTSRKSEFRHRFGVTYVAFSPDGRRTISAAHSYVVGDSPPEKCVNVWNTETGEFIDSVIGHVDWATWVEFSPDGRLIASIAKNVEGPFIAPREGLGDLMGERFPDFIQELGSGIDHNSVAISDGENGGRISRLTGHQDKVRWVTFSPCSRYLVSAANDLTMRVWHAESGKQVSLLTDHAECVTWVTFSRNGGHVAIGFEDETVQCCDIGQGKIETFGSWTDCDGTISLARRRYPMRLIDSESTLRNYAKFHGDATVVESAISGKPIAWYPRTIDGGASHPSSSRWATMANREKRVNILGLLGNVTAADSTSDCRLEIGGSVFFDSRW